MTLIRRAAPLALALSAATTPIAVASAWPDGSATVAHDTPSVSAAAPAQLGEPFARTELYFGTDKPGPDVTAAQFRRFLAKQVTPRFPDGLTVLRGLGQFRGSDGVTIRERSQVVILLYPVEVAADSSRKIEEIRDAYEKQFDQESVLRADSVDRVSF